MKIPNTNVPPGLRPPPHSPQDEQLNQARVIELERHRAEQAHQRRAADRLEIFDRKMADAIQAAANATARHDHLYLGVSHRIAVKRYLEECCSRLHALELEWIERDVADPDEILSDASINAIARYLIPMAAENFCRVRRKQRNEP
jgi:hypothetical protein